MATFAPRITPHLWFDKQAKAAAEFYVSVFPDSRVVSATELHNTPSGTVEVVSFELSGQPFKAISAGPMFQFSEAISFIVACDTQAEVDAYWEKLTSGGGQEVQCGWLKDKFGLSWQIVPTCLDRMMQCGQPERVARVTQAFLRMKKFDIAALERAFASA